MRLPDLVIAGAPKCGTSSLFRWLDVHPSVQGSSVKETNFLLDRGHPLLDPARNVHDHGLPAYGSFFPHDAEPPSGSAPLLLEGTTHYLYADTAPRVLASLPTPPHVVFLLREPAERVYSSFRYTRNNLGVLRPGATFRDFLGLGEGGDPRAVTDPRWGGKVDVWRNDVAYGRYAEHLDRWARVFPRGRMHVFLAEDLWRDPRALLRAMAERVGIDPAFYDAFPFTRHNESYRVRSTALHRLARRAGAVLPRGVLRAVLRKGYMGVLANGREERTRDDEAALRELREAYAPHNARLAAEWGLNLGAWDARLAHAAAGAGDGVSGDGRTHVLFFTSALGGGGAEKHLVRVANALDRGRFRVSVAVARGGGSYEGELAADVAYHALPGGRMRNAALPLRRLLRKERPDVVCSFMDHANCVALLATRGLAGAPAVVAGVQNPPSTSLDRVPAPIRGAIRAGMRALYPRADAVVALSRGVGDELARMIPRAAGRLSVIPNAGMDDGAPPPADPPPRAEGGGPVLVACGRLVHQKGYPVLLRALARVREQVPARLRILGEGPLRHELGALAASLGVAGAVSFEGFQPDPARYMAQADVFVLSSEYEGFGNVIVEAMAAGAPVVATDCPYGPGEILEGGRHGVLVPPGDPEAFAEAVLRVLGDGALRARLRRDGAARARDFAPAAVAAGYGRLFQLLRDARATAAAAPDTRTARIAAGPDRANTPLRKP